LHYALKTKNTELIEFLLDNDVDPNVQGPNGTCIDIAKQLNDQKILNIFISRQQSCTLFKTLLNLVLLVKLTFFFEFLVSAIPIQMAQIEFSSSPILATMGNMLLNSRKETPRVRDEIRLRYEFLYLGNLHFFFNDNNTNTNPTANTNTKRERDISQFLDNLIFDKVSKLS
jgi:hypothetical protein